MTFQFLDPLQDDIRLSLDQAFKIHLKDTVRITGDLSALLLRNGTIYFTEEKKIWQYADPIVEISKGKDFLLAITQGRKAIYYHTTSGQVEILKIDDPNLISSGLARYFVQGVKRGHHKHMVFAGGVSGFEQPIIVNSGPTQPVERLQGIQSISCGPNHTAIIKDTKLAVVGLNQYGQLGLEKRKGVNIVILAEFVDFKAPILQALCTDKGIFVRDHFGCVWFAGLLEDALNSPNHFTQIPLQQVASAIYVSKEGSLIIAHEIGASSFGYNEFNNFGFSSKKIIKTPTRITSLNGKRVTNVILTQNHSLVMAMQTKEIKNAVERNKSIVETIKNGNTTVYDDINIISYTPKNEREDVITNVPAIDQKEEEGQAVVASSDKKRKIKDSKKGPLKKKAKIDHQPVKM
jgi:hypothetical protein